MHNAEEQSGFHSHVQPQEPRADAAEDLTVGFVTACTISIGNVDLPAFVSDGVVYIQAPLPDIFEAFAEDLSAFISDLEVRVSEAGSAALSLDRHGRAFYRAAVARTRVGGSGEQR